ncbi:MAG: DUF6124 family protein [Pseudomonas sp.]|jgi:hypothetical protein
MCDKPSSLPETNKASPDASLNPEELNEATKRTIDSYLDPKPETKTKPAPNQLFTVAEGIDTESLLTNLSETLASANATISDLAFDLEGSRRQIALGIQQLIELGELLANRVLDEQVPVSGR